MRILVTGGAGFIGSHLGDALIERGHEIMVLDDLSSGRKANLHPQAKLAELDLRDPKVGDVVASFKPEVLCHYAAQIDVRKSVADPGFDADVNIVASLRLLEFCREAGTRRVLFASSGGAIYGIQDFYPATEAHPARPVSPYGCAKLAIEQYLHYYGVQYGFRSTYLRFANVYGPRQNAHGEAGVIAIFMNKLLAGGVPVINGTGEQTRDFVFVKDVVRANLLALEKDLVGVYNVGTGIETSVNELYEGIRRAVGSDVKAGHVAAKPGEQMRSCLVSSGLEKDAGFKPQTMLQQGLDETAAYFKALKQ